jgi:hypothetical protein
LQAEQEVRVAAEPVELRNDQRSPMRTAQAQRLGQLRPIGALAGLSSDSRSCQSGHQISVAGRKSAISRKERKA